MSPPVQKGEPEETEQKDITFIEMDPEPDPSLPRAIILDLSPVNFLDTVGVKTLRRVWIRQSQHVHTLHIKNSAFCIKAFSYAIH